MTEPLDPPPVAQRPSPPSRRPRRHLPKAVGLLVVATLLVGLVAGGAVAVGKVRRHFAPVPDYPGSGTGSVVVQVHSGDTASDVAVALLAEDVIKSTAAFRKAAAAEPRSTSLQPGFYKLRQQMKAALALALLLDPASRLRSRVTIPEGTAAARVLELVAKNTEVPLADLRAAAANPAALGLPAYAQATLEGFLFPATYDVEPGTSAVEVLRMMVERFDEAAAATGLEQRAAAVGRTPYEVVVVASLIERESRYDDELPKVARVIYNRLERRIPLGVDAAVLYGLGRTSGVLHRSELAKDTPYNTRLHAGLPPTPIACPGQASLEAALAPAPGDYLYYVLADKTGHHLFTASYSEFLRQKEKSQREGVF